MLRLFVGLSLPEAVRTQLTFLSGGIPGARWTEPDNYHITLTFIGEVEDTVAEDLDGVLASLRVPGFSLRLDGVDTFQEGENPKLLWAGVSAPEALYQLKEKTDRALDMSRLPFDKRKYVPHVTLARLKNPDKEKLVNFMQAHHDFTTQDIGVTSVHLYQSHQTKNGSRYDILESYPLL
jgi:2'-5' RNA ligase